MYLTHKVSEIDRTGDNQYFWINKHVLYSTADIQEFTHKIEDAFKNACYMHF